MPFHTFPRTYAERKQVLKFWQEMREEAEKIYDEYTDDKDDKFHRSFYKKIVFEKEDLKNRPDFFEPMYSKN
tara:strand:+ start:1417 stop:1632 length:216 start_codon:yes stop_codon:yes gene_type:complete